MQLRETVKEMVAKIKIAGIRVVVAQVDPRRVAVDDSLILKHKTAFLTFNKVWVVSLHLPSL